MSDEPMNSKHVNKAADDELDLRVLRALEATPGIEIPADFAARVARQLPARRPVSLTPTHSMSAPASYAARKTFRPMRPKPLIPTRTAIPNLRFVSKKTPTCAGQAEG